MLQEMHRSTSISNDKRLKTNTNISSNGETFRTHLGITVVILFEKFRPFLDQG